jgi:translation initiation factor IF-2
LQIGTPVCVPTKEGIDLGRIASMELNHKAVDTARAGQSVAMKIEGARGGGRRGWWRGAARRPAGPGWPRRGRC